MKSMFEACCTTQQPVGGEGQRPVTAPVQTTSPNAVYAQSNVPQQENGLQKAAKPVANLLAKVEEKVPMVAPLASQMRGAITTAAVTVPENDRLKPNVVTGQGEETQSFGDAIKKHHLPTVGIFPANSKTGLSTLRALTGYPHRNTCAKIHCIVRGENAIPMVRGELNEHMTDSVSYSFADCTDNKCMAMAFMGLDRLLIIPPSTEDRAELVCNSLQAAKLAGVPHVVLLSAVTAQHPNTMFGKHFRRMEECLEGMRGHVNFTIMRMSWFMDNFLDMAADIVSNNRFLSSWGPSGVSAVSLADIGRCCAAVLSVEKNSPIHYGRTYHLTGPESLSGFRMAEILTKVLGKQISYQDLPRDEMKKVYLEGMNFPQWQATGFVEMNELFKSGAGAAYSTDVAMLTQGNHTTFERFVRNKRWYFSGERSPLVCILPSSGRVGTNTLAALMRDKSHGRIRAIVRGAEHKTELETTFPKNDRIEIVNGDLEQPDTIRAALEGVDSLLIIPPEKLERFSLIDETIKAAYNAGVGHTILFSVSKALDATAIGRKFNAWERVLEQNSHSFTIIQSSLFQDLMFTFAEQIKAPERRVHHWLGQGKFCPVDARDVGEACAAVLREGPLEHHSHTYSLYGPQALNFGDMVQTLSKVLGYEIEAVPDITSDQIRATMQGKLPSFNIEEVVQAHECVATGMDIIKTPDLIMLTGQARTIQAFYEDYRSRFEYRGGYEVRRPAYEEKIYIAPVPVATAAPVVDTTVPQESKIDVLNETKVQEVPMVKEDIKTTTPVAEQNPTPTVVQS